MPDLSRRPFDWSKLSPETQEKIDDIQEAARDIADKDFDMSITLSLKLLEILNQEKEWQKEKYPENPPNASCHKALLTGILFSNETGLRLHDLIPYFSTGNEKSYIWTHSQNRSSSLLVDVDISVKSQNVWRNLASILELTVAISSSFENMVECDYDWIYSFHPEKALKARLLQYLDN